MALNPPSRARTTVIRQPRQGERQPSEPRIAPERHPHRVFGSIYALLFGFILLIVVGGVLLSLPVSRSEGTFTSLDTSFFTAVSAVTVTGHTVVNTPTYWSGFGQVVIFFLMLVGGLSFMAVSTFLLALIGLSPSLSERLVVRESIGADKMAGLTHVTRNIILVVVLFYLIGAAVIFASIRGMDGMDADETVWQSIFLSVSAFNNAGFSILPEDPFGSGLARLSSHWVMMGLLTVMIILGGIGWTVLVDVARHRRFVRLSLDSKMVIVTSMFLWAAGAGIFFLAEFGRVETIGPLDFGDKVVSAVFHSVSGRTAGFAAVDFGKVDDFTKLTFPMLMFIGGSAGSVAGGIKVVTLAVLIAAVFSSLRGRPEAEAFGRQVYHFQVLRAVTVAALGLALLAVMIPTLTVTDPDVPFVNMLFDIVSALGTNGTSTGIVPDLSLAGKSIFMVAMFVGRLGPIALALTLVSREETTTYRFAQERVRIG